MITSIDIPVYNTSVAVLVEINEQQLEEFYNDNRDLLTSEEYENLKDDLNNPKYSGVTLQTESDHFLILLKDGESDNNVSHEIFHVCNKILLNCGLIPEDDEAWAYLMGWFTEEYYCRYCQWKDEQKDNDKDA